ncbi:MAG TPA: glutamyl-tRNA reductase, partial [Xylella sp.]
MTLWVIGLNHQTAPMELRERVSFVGEALPRALDSLRTLRNVNEAALLSTCNRTELYAETQDAETLVHWLEQYSPELQSHLYQYCDAAAVKHLFRVTTGLDSMVLGESQIFGQVKNAWSMARTHGTLGTQLDRLFQHAFSVAKHTRTNTRIGANPVSVASTAVRLAQDAFSPLNESTVLLIGTGETIQLAAKYLSESQVQRLLIANRTHAKAQMLASQHGGYALPLTELNRHL